MVELRGYQTQAHMDLRRGVADGHFCQILQCPTGGGKTVVAANIIHSAEEKGSPSLFFAHRRELIYQCSDKLEEFGVNHGMIMSGEFHDTFSGCQIASIDTFRARVMQREILRWPEAKLVIIDECHRSLAPTYLKVIEHYKDRGAVILGLSATPIRGDGKGLGHIYSNMVHTPGVPELIKMGYLVPTKHYAPSVPDLVGVKTKRGDYDEQQLQAAMDKDELVGDIVTNWLRLGKGRQTLVFASGVAHSIHLREEFLRAGVRAAHLDGNTPQEERDRIIADLRGRRIEVVCNCMVLTEGFDMPTLACCVLARPTKNYGLYIQMVGRVKRPDKASGKTDSICIDHSGAVYRHGRVDEPYQWLLDEKGQADKEANAQQKLREKTNITCVKCAAVYQGQLICPECGHVPERRGQFVDSRSADLVEFDGVIKRPNPRNPGRYEQVEWFNMFLHYAEQQGYKRGWAHRKFKDKFHDWPARDFPEFEHVELSDQFLGYIRHLNIKYAYGMRRERERADLNG